MKGLKILRGAAALLSLLLCVGVLIFLGPCVHEDGSVARCHDAGTVLAVLGGAMALLSLGALLLRSPRAAAALNGISAVLAVIAFLIPGTLMPLCLMSTMRCVSVMQPSARILSFCVAALSLGAALIGFRRKAA